LVIVQTFFSSAGNGTQGLQLIVPGLIISLNVIDCFVVDGRVLVFFFCLQGAGDETQGVRHMKQVLGAPSHSLDVGFVAICIRMQSGWVIFLFSVLPYWGLNSGPMP
jgi:hypothetical protein